MHTKKAVHGCVTCSAKMIALVPYEGWLEGWVDGFGGAILMLLILPLLRSWWGVRPVPGAHLSRMHLILQRILIIKDGSLLALLCV